MKLDSIEHEHTISLINDFQTDLGEVAKLLRTGNVAEAQHWVQFLRGTWHEKVMTLLKADDWSAAYENRK